MPTPPDILLAGMILVLAAVYSAVGHGGGSGYLAAMAMLGMSPEVMKPTALALNVLVAGLALVRFGRAGAFSGRTFALFAATSIPSAFLGGAFLPPDRIYQVIVSVVLTWAALRLLRGFRARRERSGPVAIPVGSALAWGGGIGFVSGVIGVGGGIFLNPLLQLKGWGNARTAAGTVAAFVLANSVAGLGGYVSQVQHVPSAILLWAPAALVGAHIGTSLGIRRLSIPVLQRTLALVLLVAAVRLAFAGG